MGLKRPTIKLNILVLRQTNENIAVFSVLKPRVVLSEAFSNCLIVSANLKITFVLGRFLCIGEKLQISKLDLRMLRRIVGIKKPL